MQKTSLLMIGCGNMGGALLRGWAQGEFAPKLMRVDIVKPNPPSDAIQLPGVEFHTSLAELEHTPDIVVWAVKPHQLEQVVPESVHVLGEKPVYISIAAGKTIASLEQFAASEKLSIVRTMPNTPVEANVGITALTCNTHVSEIQQELVEELFASVGMAVWCEEAQINALTALCGSGPAYVYYFMECLAKAGEALGLEPETADLLARQMVFGAANLATASEESLQTLRENVTSPHGTTAAALDVWMQTGTLDTQAKEALKAAVKRAKELEV